MLNKKSFVSIFLIFFLAISNAQAKTFWKSEKILKILDNNQYLLSHDKIIIPENIKIESLFSKRNHQFCQQKKIFNLLVQLLENQKIYFKLDVKYKKRKLRKKYIKSPIKFNKTQNLEIFLLKNGLAQNKNLKNKKYIEAENIARKLKIGIWGNCNPWNRLQRNLTEKGLTKSFSQKYKFFLEGSTISWVQEILPNNFLKLRNGLTVKLQNISTGNLKNNLEKCFSEESHKFLEKNLLGKKIVLKHEQEQVLKYEVLSRYIFIPKVNYTSLDNKKNIFFNNFMIQEGFGKLKYNHLNKKNWNNKFLNILKISQEEIFKNPKGAWANCFKKEIKFLEEPFDEKNKNSKKIIKPIPEDLFDKKCRIKGNISGSKKKPIRKYHTPLSHWYKKLKYEACFDSEKKAQDAGFKKVK